MPFHSTRISFQFDNYTHVRECKEVFQGVVTKKQPFRAFMFSFSWKSWLCLLRAWKNINQKRGELQNYFEAQLSLWNALAMRIKFQLLAWNCSLRVFEYLFAIDRHIFVHFWPMATAYPEWAEASSAIAIKNLY